ncbi:MAG: hypothetical protein ACX930_07920 [Erythrobacter sp.]
MKLSQLTRTAMDLIKHFTGTTLRVIEGEDKYNRIDVARLTPLDRGADPRP